MTKKKERSTHVRCGYGGRCKEYHGTEKKTNESVRMEIGIEEETLQQTALRRKLGFFGHVMRSPIRWIGKRNDAGTRRWKEQKMTKEKMDG